VQEWHYSVFYSAKVALFSFFYSAEVALLIFFSAKVAPLKIN